MKRDKVTIESIKKKKAADKKITMLTAYDCSLSKIVDEAGIDAVLVGDSLGMVVLGFESTTEVTMEDMLRHASAARRGIKASLLIGDMPYGSFDTPNAAVKNAKRFINEAGCEAVKLEGESPEANAAIIAEGIPVMGHLGLTPQTVTEFKVQGKDAETAKGIIKSSLALEKMGCFAVVLECVPAELARIISSRLSIPTIGIGAGPYCDGQVLVINDILGMYDKLRPKFVKRYAELGELAKSAVLQYKSDVESGAFPDESHSFKIKKEELEKLL